MVSSGGIVRLKIKDQKKILPEYLTLVLNSIVVQEQIKRDGGGSIINHWLVDSIKETVIPLLNFKKQTQISELINKSFLQRAQSKQLLEIDKHGVEKAIEENEESATRWIKAELKKLNVQLEN